MVDILCGTNFIVSPLCVCSDGFLYTNGSYLSILYFIVVTIIGTYIIMTLFIVILLERFAGQDDSTSPMYLHQHRPQLREVT